MTAEATTSRIAPDLLTDIAEAFGEGPKPFPLGGRMWIPRFADVTDIKELLRKVGDLDKLGAIFDGTMSEETLDLLVFVTWIFLRKCDTNLTEDDVFEGRYKLTERHIERLLTIPVLHSREFKEALQLLMVGAGLAQSAEEAEEAAKKQPTAKRARR